MRGQNKGQQSVVVASAAMSCNVEGEIVNIPETYDADTGSICARHTCRAMVEIVSVADCGPSVTIPINSGELIEINFAYTLQNTTHIFPGMKAKYPGLKKGQRFTARVAEKPKMGGGVWYTVYDYKVK